MANLPPELLFLLVAGIISLINWLVERAKKVRQEAAKAQKRRESTTGVDLSRLERSRRSAASSKKPQPQPKSRLPLTEQAAPPRPPGPKPTASPRPVTPAETVRQPTARPQATPLMPHRRRRRPPRRRAGATTPARTAVDRTPGAAVLPANAADDRPLSWRELAAGRSGWRVAFVLREILGPPRAMRPYSPPKR